MKKAVTKESLKKIPQHAPKNIFWLIAYFCTTTNGFKSTINHKQEQARHTNIN